MTLSQFRRSLYRGARILGDVQAARSGPEAMGKRMVRKAVYMRTNSTTRALLKTFGLGR